MIGIQIRSNDKEMRDIVHTLSVLSKNFDSYLVKLMSRFAGTFRRNVYAALVRNEPWAKKNWAPLSLSTIKRKGHAHHFLRTGLLHKSLRTNANDLHKAIGRTGDGFVLDLAQGLIKATIYPKNKRGTTTLDAFMINEYGSKNDRPPSRPVVMPAFWKTLQMFELDREFVNIVNKELPGVFA